VNRNYVFEDASEALPALLAGIRDNGSIQDSRAGRTLEYTHLGITLEKPLQRELIVPERKPILAAQIAETVWVLAGRNDVEWLGHYLSRAADFSDDGKVWRAGYGPRLRHWDGEVDQLAEVVRLLKADPNTRQAVMSIWDPAVDTQPSKDIPCNDWLHFLGRNGILDLHVAIRSNDAIWGWSGINQFEWSVLLEVVAALVGQRVGKLHFSVTSWHLYQQHWDKAKRIATAPPLTFDPPLQDSPRFKAHPDATVGDLDRLLGQWFAVEESIRNGNPSEYQVGGFPEPMLQSWLRVLQWWWTGDAAYLEPLKATRLHAGTQMSVQPKWLLAQGGPTPSDFARELCKLHLEKHEAYGDSWKRRGEMLGIMANIARKIDRLGGAETSDETQADTAGDLLVYLAKAMTWYMDHASVKGQPLNAGASDDPALANEIILDLDRKYTGGLPWDLDLAAASLREQFTKLEAAVMANDPERYRIVTAMLPTAYELARAQWEKLSNPLGFVGGDYDLP
jgi:thymidylate synthase